MLEKERSFYERRIEVFLYKNRSHIYEDKIKLKGEYCLNDVPFQYRMEKEYKPIGEGENWGENWQRAWFSITGEIPEKWKGKTVCAIIHLGGEACIYDNDGIPVQGLSVHTIWMIKDFIRDRYILTRNAQGGEKVDLWVFASAAQLFGLVLDENTNEENPKRLGYYEGIVKEMEIRIFRQDIWELFLTMNLLFQQMKALHDSSVRRARILRVLNQVIDQYDRKEDKIVTLINFIKKELFWPASVSDLKTYAVGHAHIDTAWLWPLRETIHKCARTFSNQLKLIEENDEYIFGASQAQHYHFIKIQYPALYQKIKEQIKKGRWEVQGGMWVEADCNIIGSESMVRQILYGKKFFQEEFHVNINNLWLPDVFGYSAALPQILKKSGIDYMVTQKLSWNQFNRFPHHTFFWKGIDQSGVIVHFPPEDNYNSELHPENLLKAKENFSEKDRLDSFLTLFGIGDGGGGPTEEIVKYGEIQRNMEGAPQVLFKPAAEYLETLREHVSLLDIWTGELYLELHRGTLTSQAFNKKMNRFFENRLRELEFLYSSVSLKEYPTAHLEKLWKVLLLNQFHDIIPGSSIHQVYEDCKKHYSTLKKQTDLLIQKWQEKFVQEKNYTMTVFNTLACSLTKIIFLPPEWLNRKIIDSKGNTLPVQWNNESEGLCLIKIRPFSYETITALDNQTKYPLEKLDGTSDILILENSLIRYEFNSKGRLVSSYDKIEERENIPNGEEGNRLLFYHDLPNDWDAWDVDIFYEKQFINSLDSIETTNFLKGDVRSQIRFEFQVSNSKITQTVSLANDSKRLDFCTEVHWNETHKMLRVQFPTNIYQERASFEIQFGYVERNTHRNTSWDMAKFETVGHRYADLSNHDYGISILNDCKYGYKVHHNIMELNLLRSPVNPDPDADKGFHKFTYSYYPHKESLTESDVVKQGLILNHHPIMIPGIISDLKFPLNIENSHCVLESLKKAEKEEALIFRFYEPYGKERKEKIIFHQPVIKAVLTNLLEEEQEILKVKNGVLELSFSPFEIKTMKVFI